jgi:hypothetical protein
MNGQPTQTKTEKSTDLSCPWLKRIGLIGFCFFLAKGILWLVLPAILVWFGLAD